MGLLMSIDGSGLACQAAQQLHECDGRLPSTPRVILWSSSPWSNPYRMRIFTAVAIGLGTFVIVRLMKGYAPKVPAALIALILMTVIVAVFGLDQKGVDSAGGQCRRGLPSLTLPNIPLSDYLRLLPGAMAVVGITLCEALLLVRSCEPQAQHQGRTATRCCLPTA